MQPTNDILNELREMGSPLADMSRTMPYHVPKGYFVALHTNLVAFTKTYLSDDVAFNKGKEMPFALPQGYFDQLPQAILDAAKAEDMDTLSLPKAIPFATPAGYFEQLPEQILQAAKASDQKKDTKIIPLGSRIGRSLKWAAAAILLMGIGIASYNIYNNDTPNIKQQIAALPNNTLSDYVQQNATDFNTSVGNNALAAGGPEALNKLNDQEIINYLDETGWDEPIIN